MRSIFYKKCEKIRKKYSPTNEFFEIDYMRYHSYVNPIILDYEPKRSFRISLNSRFKPGELEDCFKSM
jgi:hypothetical protein